MQEITNKQKQALTDRVATLQRCIDEIDTMSKADFMCAFGATFSSTDYILNQIMLEDMKEQQAQTSHLRFWEN